MYFSEIEEAKVHMAYLKHTGGRRGGALCCLVSMCVVGSKVMDKYEQIHGCEIPVSVNHG